jgi:hypothetical protein
VKPESNRTIDERAWPSSPHDAARFILSRLPGSYAVDGAPLDPERIARPEEAPVLIEPALIESPPFRSYPVADAFGSRGTSGFSAFMDGAQAIRIVTWFKGIPIVWATVSAAVRVRIDRRLVTWTAGAPIVRSRFYIPLRYLPELAGSGSDDLFVDTAASDSAGRFPSRHPAALMEAAVKRVQQDRERCEMSLAEAWCELGTGTLYVDGGISGSESTARSRNVVGVVKSHRRIYADGDAFQVLVELGPGCRSSIFELRSTSRPPVASWYVRTRSAKGRDALFSLVRVEAACSDDVASRADELSRWLIAEGAPLALPDSRWDKVAYGIHDTEEFLRAIS